MHTKKTIRVQMTEESKTPYFDGLSDKNKDMVDYYMEVKRVKKAAYLHGYHPNGSTKSDAHIRVDASRAFANANVIKAIKEKFKKKWDSRAEYNGQIADELAAIAFHDQKEMLEFGENGSFKFKNLEDVDTRHIASFKASSLIGKDGEFIEIKSNDKVKALGLLMELNGLKHIKIEDVTDFNKQQEKLKHLSSSFKEEINQDE